MKGIDLGGDAGGGGRGLDRVFERRDRLTEASRDPHSVSSHYRFASGVTEEGDMYVFFAAFEDGSQTRLYFDRGGLERLVEGATRALDKAA